MSRPNRNGQRVSTAIRFKPETLARLHEAADERDVSVNWLVNRACEEFLARLIPVDEMRLTRDDPNPRGETMAGISLSAQ